MANTESAKKRVRQTIERTARNKSKMNMLRTFVRKVEDLIAAGKKDEATKAFDQAQSAIAKTAQKGIIKRNTAGRKVSRLSARIKALS